MQLKLRLFWALLLSAACSSVYATPLGINTFSPASAYPGTVVTITFSSAFTGLTAVQFGGVSAVTFSAVSGTVLTATVPCNAASGSISVTVTGGTFTKAGFTLLNIPVSSISITGSPAICAGSSLTLTGPAGGPEVTTFAGSGTYGATNGTGTAATFSVPACVAFDPAGNAYVGETGSNLIRKITPAGVVTTFAGSSGGGTDGTGTAAQFINPRGIIYDAFSGNLFVAEASNRVRKVTLAGVVTLFAGAANGSGGETDGTGTGATLNSPNAITADASGNLYVTESGGNRIRKITAAGVVTTFAGSGTPGHADGTGTNATFSSPNGITIDGSGNLYIVENYSIIRKITPAGVVSTFAGSITGGLNDGTGSAAQFAGASGITADAAGNLYVSENSNRIRKITTAAVVTTIAGSTAGGSTNGFGVAAKFQTPGGMAVDASGDLFVADFSNNVIRKVQTSSPFIIDSYIWSNGSRTRGIKHEAERINTRANGSINVIWCLETADFDPSSAWRVC